MSPPLTVFLACRHAIQAFAVFVAISLCTVAYIGGRVGPTLSLAGVLVVSLGAFLLATTYDRRPVERRTGFAVGGFLMALGLGLFIAGWLV